MKARHLKSVRLGRLLSSSTNGSNLCGTRSPKRASTSRYRPVINLGAGPHQRSSSQGGPNETAIPVGDITPRRLGLRPTIPATCRCRTSHNAGQLRLRIIGQHDACFRRDVHGSCCTERRRGFDYPGGKYGFSKLPELHCIFAPARDHLQRSRTVPGDRSDLPGVRYAARRIGDEFGGRSNLPGTNR